MNQKLYYLTEINLPQKIPSMSSMLVGYFSYDIIRLIEKIPDKCKNDIDIPDIRLTRPKNLIIYDNVKRKIFYIHQHLLYFISPAKFMILINNYW